MASRRRYKLFHAERGVSRGATCTTLISRRFAAAGTCAAACLLAALPLSGCLESDVIVNYMQDQDSGEVNTNLEEKLYIPDKTAEITMEDIATKSNMTKEELKKVVEDQATLQDGKNTDEKAEQTEWAKNGSSKSTTSKRVNGESTKKSDAQSDDEGDKSNTGKSGNRNSSVNSSNNVYDSSYGNMDDLPTDIDTACAVGNAATVVMSIAGKGHLVGADKAWLDDTNIQTVFESRGVTNVKQCWNVKGAVEIDKVIAADPDAVFVTSGEDSLTAKQEKQLGDAHIRVITLPSFKSDSNIKDAVKAVGICFSDNTSNASKSLASDYASAVDTVLQQAKDSHGGKVATYANRDYNNASNSKKEVASSMADPNWCLYVDAWDSSATVTVTFNGETVVKGASGVAATTIGWGWSPISYYMSCGGAINNAAAYGESLEFFGSKRAVLQYNENQVVYKWSSEPSGVKLGAAGGSFNKGTCSLTNAYDAVKTSSEDAGHPLGQQDFNRVFVRTQAVKDSFEAAQHKGLYTAASYTTVSNVSGYGHVYGGKLLYTYSCTANSQRGDTGYEVVVNPCGMAGSWTDGSMESFLESVWVASQYCSDKVNESDVREDIRNFYEKFYGYTPKTSEMNKIISGTFAKD